MKNINGFSLNTNINWRHILKCIHHAVSGISPVLIISLNSPVFYALSITAVPKSTGLVDNSIFNDGLSLLELEHYGVYYSHSQCHRLRVHAFRRRLMSSQQPSFAATIDVLREQVPENLMRPVLGIVCGSGLHTLVSNLQESVLVAYDILPGFGQSTVPGHKSSLAFGYLGSSSKRIPVVVMLGRFHPYEGHTMASVVYPIRVMAKLGVQRVLITNASGGLNPNLDIGTIVVIQDHLALPNLCGFNPLLGPQTDLQLPRFLPLSNAYSRDFRKLAFKAAHELKLPREALAEGVYAWVSGPSYETPAEGRLLRLAGADVVGMSTIPEVLAAREMGLEAIVLSLVTNKVVIPETYDSVRDEFEAELAGKVELKKKTEYVVSHEEVLHMGREKADVMKTLVEKIAELISDQN